MEDREEEYLALSWFIAGYFSTNPSPPRGIQTEHEAARAVAKTYLERYGRDVCLKCGRSQVVLIDGFFCERCHPNVEMIME